MKKPKKSLVANLFDFAGNYKILIILSWLLSAVSSILAIGPFICIWFIMQAVLQVSPNYTNATLVVEYAWWAVAFAVISIVLYFMALLCSHLAAFRVEKNIRKRAMHSLVDLPLGYFQAHTSGSLRKIIDDNAGLTHGFLAHQLPDLAGVVVMPVVTIVVLLTFEWKLGIICLLPLATSLLFLKQMMGGERAKCMNQYLNALEKMNADAVEYIRGIPVVKVFQQTVYSFKNFHASIREYWQFAAEFALACRKPFVGFIVTINSPALLIIPASIVLLSTATNAGEFLLDILFYMLFIPLCSSTMGKIMHASESIMVAKEALERVNNVITADKFSTGSCLEFTTGSDVSFENVIFNYPGNAQAAVSNVSFSIPQGKTYALVGPSGGGKSTIAMLIPRFWDVSSGSIKIGGTDVRDFTEQQLMEKIAFVFQNTRLFKASILENICAGQKSLDRERAIQAANLAQCDDILEKMPAGIDTLLGSEGIYLSGGEQQRVALARAILKDAPIIILDEATAFADPENEYLIQRAFQQLTKEKTVLMIAHRLSTIKNVDCILVVKDGQICEQGSHQELINKNGVYAQMWQEYQSAISWKVERC